MQAFSTASTRDCDNILQQPHAVSHSSLLASHLLFPPNFFLQKPNTPHTTFSLLTRLQPLQKRIQALFPRPSLPINLLTHSLFFPLPLSLQTQLPPHRLPIQHPSRLLQPPNIPHTRIPQLLQPPLRDPAPPP